LRATKALANSSNHSLRGRGPSGRSKQKKGPTQKKRTQGFVRAKRKDGEASRLRRDNGREMYAKSNAIVRPYAKCPPEVAVLQEGVGFTVPRSKRVITHRRDAVFDEEKKRSTGGELERTYAFIGEQDDVTKMGRSRGERRVKASRILGRGTPEEYPIPEKKRNSRRIFLRDQRKGAKTRKRLDRRVKKREEEFRLYIGPMARTLKGKEGGKGED